MKCPNCGITLKRVDRDGRLWEVCPDPECQFQTSASNITIDQVYCFVARDKDGNEGIPAFRGPQGPMPMVCADTDRLTQLKTLVPQLKRSGLEIKLLRFTTREELPLP